MLDCLFARLGMLIVGLVSDKKRTIDDFLLFFGDESKRTAGTITDPEAMKRFFMAKFGGGGAGLGISREEDF